MPHPAKRNSRLLLIAGLAVGFVVAAGTAYFVRQRQLDAQALALRAQGCTALAAGDYEGALDGIGRYLLWWQKKGSVTSEDYLLYAQARRHVPLPNGEHLFGAMAKLRKALELDPSSRAVQDELLDVYLHVGFATEAVELVDSMLAVAPADVELLTTKCDLLEGEREYSRALEVARRIHELEPEELSGPVRTLRLMIRSGATDENVNMWLAAVTTAHADDARFDLLRAAWFTRRQEREKAHAALDRVLGAAAASKDPKFLALLIGELDEAERFDDALRVVEEIEATDDPALQRECVRRYFYAGRFDDLLARSAAWSADATSADADILGLRALALSELGRKADVTPIRTALAERTDSRATAWSTCLAQLTSEGTPDPAQAVAVMAEAAKSAPDNAVLLVALGDARAALGETDAAIHTWTAASAFARAWARPLCRIADTLRRSGRPELAVSAAKSALSRAPRQYEAVSTWMRTLAAVAPRLDANQIDWVLETAARIRKDAPKTAGDLLPIEVGLLVRSDRRRAEAALRTVLESPGEMNEDSLLRLARIADDADIPLGPRILDASEKLHGLTPRLAVARATATSRVAGSASGLRVMDELRTRTGAPSEGPDWDVARATFLDSVGDAEAAGAWIALADANPAVLSHQLRALSCGAVWDHRDAVARIVDRVRTATGDAGVAWRTARGRLLLGDPASTKESAEEARTLLDAALLVAPGSPSVRVLLAQALERLGNVDGAEEQLQSAASLSPEDRSIPLELARLSMKRGRADVAKQHLERAVASPGLSPSETQLAASLLAELGEFGRSADLLQSLTGGSHLDRRGTLLLAATRSRMGDYEGALEILETQLDPPDRQVLELAAELFATVGRTADAQAALERLGAMGLPAGDVALVQARIAKHGKVPGAAKDAFRRAVAADPGRAAAWAEYVSFAVSTGDTATLAEILDDPVAAETPSVRFLRDHRADCVMAMRDARLRPLLAGAIEDEANRAVLLEAAVAVAERWDDPARRRDAVRRVQEIAAANPRVLAVQLLAADLLVQVGEARPAADVAVRTMQGSQSSASAAQQAARLLGAAGRWTEAVEAARTWKDRSGLRDAQPDLFLAGALLQVDRGADAAAALEPHVNGWLAAPDENRDAVLTYLVALARSRRIAKVEEILGELVVRSATWRTAPLEVQAEWLHDAGCAAEWLDVCTHNVPQGDAAARLRLARAWGSAWTRFGGTELLARARQVIAELTASEDPPADAWFYEGVLAEGAGDLMAATRGYQSALERDPRQAAARNNLATIQADTGQWEAAVENGRRLVAEHPRVPEFLDTLASALRKGRKFDEARSAMQAAVNADPLNPAWRIGLAEVLAESGEPAEVTRILARVEEMASVGRPLPPDLRGRVDRLRTRRR